LASTFEISPLADAVGLRLSGEFDRSSLAELRRALASVSTKSELVLDLSELTFMDSSGLGALLSLAGSRNGNGPVVLRNPSAPLERLLALVAIEQHPNIEVLRSVPGAEGDQPGTALPSKT
jgi:anti-anti-sigma factor